MGILEIVLKLVLAIALGGIIGLERKVSHKPAGIKTNIMVCVTSTMTMILAELIVHDKAGVTDSILRMAAGMMTGIGFLGAGTIIREKGTVVGLTTASTIWFVSGLGLVIGAGYYVPALIFAVITLATLVIFREIEEPLFGRAQYNYRIRAVEDFNILPSVRKIALHYAVRMEKFSVKKDRDGIYIGFSFTAPEQKELDFAQSILGLKGIEDLRVD